MIDDYKYVEVPRDCLESVIPICPLCHDTKTTDRPSQTIKLSIDPEYKTYCHNCKVWWKTHKKYMKNNI